MKMSREGTCSICTNTVVETKEMNSFIDDEVFTIYPHEFADRFEESSSRLNGIDYYAEVEYSYGMVTYSEDNYLYYRIQDINDNYSDIGMISFTEPNGETISAIDEFSKNSFNCINILIEDSYDVSAVVYAAILAIDPSIGYSEAADVGQAIVDDLYDLRLVDDEYVDSITKNEKEYGLSMSKYCRDKMLRKNDNLILVQPEIFVEFMNYREGFDKRNKILQNILIRICATGKYYPTDLQIIQDAINENRQQIGVVNDHINEKFKWLFVLKSV